MNYLLPTFLLVLITGCTTIVPEPLVEKPRVGLLRTYVEGALPQGTALSSSEIYESVTEEQARRAFLEKASGFGFPATQEAALSVSINVQASEGAAARAGQSRLQIRERGIDPVTPILNTSDFDDAAAPAILLGSRDRGRAAVPGTLRMRIVINKEGKPLWTGVAHAPLDGRPRTALAAAMAGKLAEYIGQDFHQPEVRFRLPAQENAVTIRE